MVAGVGKLSPGGIVVDTLTREMLESQSRIEKQ